MGSLMDCFMGTNPYVLGCDTVYYFMGSQLVQFCVWETEMYEFDGMNNALSLLLSRWDDETSLIN